MYFYYDGLIEGDCIVMKGVRIHCGYLTEKFSNKQAQRIIFGLFKMLHYVIFYLWNTGLETEVENA